MAKSHLRLTLSLILSLASEIASAQQPATPMLPKPDQTPAPAQPGVRQIPPPKAPAPAAPAPVAPTMPTQKPPVVAPAGATKPKVDLQRFADGLAILLLNLGAYTDPSAEQKKRIMIALNSLKQNAYEVQPLLSANTTEPVMQYISFDLFKQFLRMEAAVSSGAYSYARYLLRQVTQYTVPATTTVSRKSPLLQFPEAPTSLSDLEKAAYFAAIKRYEDSMLAYERVLSDKKFRQSRPELWEKAVENLMAITIRLRNDAHITLEMSSALREDESSNVTQKEMLQSWRASAKAWTAEGVSQKLSGQEVLTKAQQIIDRGMQLTNKGRNFGTIEYLRAMSLLNELAMSQQPDTLKARGFQLSGKTSEKLHHVFLWLHPDAYYEACIRALPHSTESRECLKLLESFQSQQKDVIPDHDKFKQLTELAR